MPRKGPCILVIDDDVQLARDLRNNLLLNNYECLVAHSGEEGLKLLDAHHIDLVLLDLWLPQMSGLDVCRKMRSQSPSPPIVVISVLGKDKDIVQALDLGADDYVSKPFAMDVLLARIRVRLRAANPMPTTPVQSFTAGPLEIDFSQHIILLNGEYVTLSNTEYALLEVLVMNNGKIVTTKMLLSKVWGDVHSNERQFVHVYINRLRKKIEPDPAHPRFIRSERGIGYRFMLGD
jgi:two-component system, OmpR family, KDP operon response regulator KdpE